MSEISTTYKGADMYLEPDMANESISVLQQEMQKFMSSFSRFETWVRNQKLKVCFSKYINEFPPEFDSGLYEEVLASFNAGISTISEVSEEIKNYSNDGGNGQESGFLNDFLGMNSGSSTYSGYVGVSSSEKAEFKIDKLSTETIISNLGGDSILNSDSAVDDILSLESSEILVGSSGGAVVSGYTGGFNSSSIDTGSDSVDSVSKIASLVGIEDLDGDGVIESDEISEALSSTGTSTSFFVPSFTTGGSDGVKSSSVAVIGAGGIAAAAAAALGGKVYYDKKKEDEDGEKTDAVSVEDEKKIEEVENKEEQTDNIQTEVEQIDEGMTEGAVANITENQPNLNVVEFKEQLLQIGEEDN